MKCKCAINIFFNENFYINGKAEDHSPAFKAIFKRTIKLLQPQHLLQLILF